MSSDNTRAAKSFYVGRGDTRFGPWSIQQITTALSAGEIAATDFIYDETRTDWVPLLEFKELKELFNGQKPAAPPPKATQQIMPMASKYSQIIAHDAANSTVASGISVGETTSSFPSAPIAAPKADVANVDQAKGLDQWFIQKGTNRYGPLSYREVIQALQEKTVYDFDFICQAGSDNWERVAEHTAFHADKIKEMLLTEGSGKKSSVFQKRQFPRRPFQSDVIIHDERNAWVGQCYEASVGGSGLVIESSVLSPGQVVKLHFSPAEGLPAFNALAEIVGKKYSREVRGAKSPVKYAVRFLQIGPRGSALENQIKSHFAGTAVGM